MSSGSEDSGPVIKEKPRRSSFHELTTGDTDRPRPGEYEGQRKTSTGCERKVSIRRRKISSIAVGENPKPIPVIQWGQQVEEYEQIVKRVMADPYVTQSLEALKERLRLLRLMQDDCADMISKRLEIETRKKNRIEMKRTFVIITYILVALSIFAVSLKVVTMLIIN
ncbi:uncharacterized protein LOC135484338 [Lineus longissimus]|uniref:uncharacterized protein LOC135484338 n=1 Tax=Lineus longissimus TaxID=88925 RepID=UPI002B4F32A8